MAITRYTRKAAQPHAHDYTKWVLQAFGMKSAKILSYNGLKDANWQEFKPYGHNYEAFWLKESN